MATVLENAVSSQQSAVSVKQERHQSQLDIFRKLDVLREAVLDLPDDAEIHCMVELSSIFLDRDLFMSQFRGQSVRVDEYGAMFLTLDGVSYATSRLQSSSKQVTL